MTDDSRGHRDRNRIFDLQRDMADRTHGPIGLPSLGSPSLLGKVIDGGAIPTAIGRYYLVNPGRYGGEPVEGGTATATWDATRKVPVFVAGGQPYQAGDELVARLVSQGRWAAEGKPKPPICVSGRICVTVDGGGCSDPVTGITVQVTDDASPPNVVGTPVTVGVIASVSLANSGSGYTNGTGYALGISGDGSGATGTFDVVAGHVTNVVITNSGAGYSTATITFPGAGGSGATATATIKGRACIALPHAGTYHVTTKIPGAADQTANVNAICGQDNNVTITLPTGLVKTLCVDFMTCDGEPTGFVPGSGTANFISSNASLSFSLPLVNGSACAKVGSGFTGNAASITSSSGKSSIARFFSGVAGPCPTLSLSFSSITASYFAASGNSLAAPGCSGTLDVQKGAQFPGPGLGSIGTGTFNLTLQPSGGYASTIKVTFTEEIFVNESMLYYEINTSWPDPRWNVSGGTSGAIALSCYTQSAPASVFIANGGSGGPCHFP